MTKKANLFSLVIKNNNVANFQVGGSKNDVLAALAAVMYADKDLKKLIEEALEVLSLFESKQKG